MAVSKIPSKYGKPLGPLSGLGDLRAKIKEFSGHTFRGASGGLVNERFFPSTFSSV